MVVDVRSRFGVKVFLFQELNEFKDITFGQVVWKCCRKKLVVELGDALQHGAERGSEEADNRATGMELLLSFWKDVCVGECAAFAHRPWTMGKIS